MKSIFKAVAIVTIFSVITRALGFFFRIFLTRKLGAEGIGLYQMATSILGIFITLVSSGIPLTTAKIVSKYETTHNLKQRNKAVTSALVVSIIVSVFSSLIIVLLKNVWGMFLTDTRAGDLLLVLIPSIIFSAIYAVFRGALWGQNDYFNCGLTEFIEQIFRFVLTFILLFNIKDWLSATTNTAIAFNFTCLFSAIFVFIIYLKRCKLDFKPGEYKQVIKSSLPITGIRLASSLVQPLTSIIIPNMLIFSGFSTSEAISSFGVIMGMTFPMLFVPMSVIGSISMVLIPSISSMMAKKDYSSIEENISNSINVSIFISMMFIPLYLSVGDLIGIVLFNNSLSGMLLQVSAVCVLPITLCNLTSSILNALNLETKSFINYIIGSCVLLASLIITTPLIGINSVVISFFLSMGIITLLNVRKIKSAINNLSINLFAISFKYSLIILPSSLLGHFVSNICIRAINPFITACFGGGIAILSTLILCKVFNLFDLSILFKLILKKKSKTNKV